METIVLMSGIRVPIPTIFSQLPIQKDSLSSGALKQEDERNSMKKFAPVCL